ncbi:Uncharacterised protein [Mycobacteroides abscessus subsp. abscessus]|nr:Uncharacterised protein [Mycobacteroides abscessus subsp. abscessus]
MARHRAPLPDKFNLMVRLDLRPVRFQHRPVCVFCHAPQRPSGLTIARDGVPEIVWRPCAFGGPASEDGQLCPCLPPVQFLYGLHAFVEIVTQHGRRQ